jgi:hypothetical protein
MGFIDKAKQMAEQAQQKLDEAQKNFNQSGAPGAEPQEGSVKYDAHGRPIEEAPPAGATPPPAAAPAEPAEPAEPAAEPTQEQPAPSPPPADGDANSTPDPFKPIQ